MNTNIAIENLTVREIIRDQQIDLAAKDVRIKELEEKLNLINNCDLSVIERLRKWSTEELHPMEWELLLETIDTIKILEFKRLDALAKCQGLEILLKRAAK